VKGARISREKGKVMNKGGTSALGGNESKRVPLMNGIGRSQEGQGRSHESVRRKKPKSRAYRG